MLKFLSLFLVCLIATTVVEARSFKCWTNKEGFRECGNSIPPEYINQQIQYHSVKSGQVHKVKEAAKTPLQLEAEKKQKKIETAEQREIAKQKAYDDVLLKTYLSIDDLMLSLQWKVTTLDSRIKVAEGTIIAQQTKFLNYTNEAANAERQGRVIPKTVRENLKDTRNKINKANQLIAVLEEDKNKIRDKFRHDIERFTIASINGLSLTLSDDEKAFALLASQINCKSKERCHHIWDMAKQFVDKNSPLKIAFDTDIIYSTESPAENNQLALSVSKIDPDYHNQSMEKKITLQIRCHPSSEGELRCKSEKVQSLLLDFKKLEL